MSNYIYVMKFHKMNADDGPSKWECYVQPCCAWTVLEDRTIIWYIGEQNRKFLKWIIYICLQAFYLIDKVTDERKTSFILSKILIYVQIIVPSLVNVTWCSYFLDMLQKCVHVADPTYVRSNENELKKMHDSNVKKILCAMTTVVKELYSGWEANFTTWDTNTWSLLFTVLTGTIAWPFLMHLQKLFM